jgi:hypothetical protein
MLVGMLSYMVLGVVLMLKRPLSPYHACLIRMNLMRLKSRCFRPLGEVLHGDHDD